MKNQPGTAGAVLSVRVIPRAKKNAVDGLMADGTLKIRLAAPPVEGKANLALVRYLADILDIPPSHIEIVAGQRGRDKLVSIRGMEAEAVQEKIMGKGAGEY